MKLCVQSDIFLDRALLGVSCNHFIPTLDQGNFLYGCGQKGTPEDTDTLQRLDEVFIRFLTVLR